MTNQKGRRVTLLEVATARPTSVDPETGVIRGVKILGRESLNGRVYEKNAVQAAVGLYENQRVNFDHPDKRRPDDERKIADRAGWLENVHVDAMGGLSGDLHLLKEDRRSAKVLEAAQRRPDLFGLSHNAEGRAVKRNGSTLVEEIYFVRSVDIVSDPATTKSLFESMEVNNMDETQSGVATMEVAPEETGPKPEEAVKKSFEQAIIAIVKDDAIDKAAKLSKIKALLAAEEKALGEVASASAEETSAAAEETPESVRKDQAELKQLRAEKKARTLLEAKGIQPTAVRVEAVASMSEEGALKLMETWPKDAGIIEKPRSTGLRESQTSEELPKTAEEFAAAFLE